MDSKKPNRRGFLKGGAAIAGVAAGAAQTARGQAPAIAAYSKKELIGYGERSHFVTSLREPAPGRPSPDAFGLVFHVATPLQDQTGFITPSSLHYTATHRGAFVPDIDPKEHRLMIHGMVDRPVVYTMDDLKRFPSVTRFHFIECAGNNARASHKNGSTVAWADEHRSLDRSSSFHAVEGSRCAKWSGLDRGRGRGRSERRLQHPADKGDG